LIYRPDPARGRSAKMSSWYSSKADCDNMRSRIAARGGHDASPTACLAVPGVRPWVGKPYVPPQDPRIVCYLYYMPLRRLPGFGGDGRLNHNPRAYDSLATCEDGMRDAMADPALHLVAPMCSAIVEPDKLWLGNYGPENITVEPRNRAVSAKQQTKWILIYRQDAPHGRSAKMGRSYSSKVDCERAATREAANGVAAAQPKACLAVPRGLSQRRSTD
jgi:hypothetical protein